MGVDSHSRTWERENGFHMWSCFTAFTPGMVKRMQQETAYPDMIRTTKGSDHGPVPENDPALTAPEIKQTQLGTLLTNVSVYAALFVRAFVMGGILGSGVACCLTSLLGL
jgi:hypothetical protein